MSLKAILLPAILALSFTACASEGKKPLGTPAGQSAPLAKAAKAPKEDAAREIRVGLLLPLSGPYADVGQALLNAAAISIFDTGDSRLVLVPRDTAGTTDGATTATTALLSENVDIIAGPLLAAEVRAAAAVLKTQNSDIRLIGFSSDRTVAGHGTYLLSFAPEEEVRRVVEYAASQGKKTFAALVPQSPYGDTVGRAFRANVSAAGGSVTDYVIYPPDAKGVMNPIKRIARYDERLKAKAAQENRLKSLADPVAMADARAKARDPMALPYDALLLPEGAALMRVMEPLLPYYEITSKSVQLLGTGLWNDPSLVRDQNLQGAWFAAPPQDKAQAFLDRYRSLYRNEPPRITTLAYDAVALIGLLAKAGAGFTDASLTDSEGFTGIDGIFRFRGDGLAERGLAIMTFGPAGITTISPAPTSFAP